MARLGVTYQDIANAADQIVGQGRQPTIELIRNLLGTGSTTTIANHLRKWRFEQDGSTSVALKENLPQEFISVMKGLWQRLQAHADSQISTVKQDSDQALAQLRQEVEKYKLNNQRWQKLHDGWLKEKSESSREKLALEQEIVNLKTKNTALIAKSEAAQQQVGEKQQRIDELRHLHKLAQENLEHHRESTRVQRIIDQEKYAQQLQQVELARKNVEQELDKANNENAVLQNANTSISNQLDKSQSEYKILEKQQADLQREALHGQQQYDILQNKFDEQNTTLIEQQKQNALLTQQLAIAKEATKELQKQNKILANEKLEIVREKAQLEGINKQMQKMMHTKEPA